MLLYQFKRAPTRVTSLSIWRNKGSMSPMAEMAYRYADELLDMLEATIGSGGFLAGGKPTIADCTAFATFQTARERFGKPLGGLGIPTWTPGTGASGIGRAPIFDPGSLVASPTDALRLFFRT